MRAPITSDELNVAILWLESNEGGGDEQAACERVAGMLKAELEERTIKSLMREHKCNRTIAKAALAKARGFLAEVEFKGQT